MAQHTAQDVADYLNRLDPKHEATPKTLTLGKETYQGADYTNQVSQERTFYLLGETPKPYRTNHAVFERDGQTWYVGGGYTPHLCKPWGKADFVNRFTGSDIRQYHPFGFWFHLSRWPTETHGPIDQHEKPRRRVKFSLGGTHAQQA
jgi:hypothetical protein